MKVLVAGDAGFIGYHICRALSLKGDDVTGIDDMKSYYDPVLKKVRVIQNVIFQKYRYLRVSILDKTELESVLKDNPFDYVIHLAGQVGARYGLNNPLDSLNINIGGMINVLDMCRKHNVTKIRSFIHELNKAIILRSFHFRNPDYRCNRKN